MQKSNGLSFQAFCSRDHETSSKGSSSVLGWRTATSHHHIFYLRLISANLYVCVHTCVSVYAAQTDFFKFLPTTSRNMDLLNV